MGGGGGDRSVRSEEGRDKVIGRVVKTNLALTIFIVVLLFVTIGLQLSGLT